MSQDMGEIGYRPATVLSDAPALPAGRASHRAPGAVMTPPLRAVGERPRPAR